MGIEFFTLFKHTIMHKAHNKINLINLTFKGISQLSHPFATVSMHQREYKKKSKSKNKKTKL